MFLIPLSESAREKKNVRLGKNSDHRQGTSQYVESVVHTLYSQEELRVFRRCSKKHVINSAASNRDTRLIETDKDVARRRRAIMIVED